MPSLFVHYEGRSYPANKDNFIIGRGTQGTDLTIRDQNVSRKHASVILHGGAFYIQDLGSTNGVEFRGGRVDSRKIEEGDVYTICDHEIVFSFRG
jgi:pSer/pThr/pTyr-binding forkhead associated (FHA) protein